MLDDLDGELLLDLGRRVLAMEGHRSLRRQKLTSSLFSAFSASKFLGMGAPDMLSMGSILAISFVVESRRVCLEWP